MTCTVMITPEVDQNWPFAEYPLCEYVLSEALSKEPSMNMCESVLQEAVPAAAKDKLSFWAQFKRRCLKAIKATKHRVEQDEDAELASGCCFPYWGLFKLHVLRK